MLVLLKPWRNVAVDLKRDDQTWEMAFDEFILSTTATNRRIISNIQYFHACENAAQQGQDADLDDIDVEIEGDDGDAMDCEMETEDDLMDQVFDITEETIEAAELNTEPWRETLHGHLAIEKAQRANIFPESREQWAVTAKPVHCATGNDLRRLVEWRIQMKQAVDAQNARQQANEEPNAGQQKTC